MDRENNYFICIKTYSHLLNESDIKDYIALFNENNFEIIVQDQTGEVINSVTDFMTDVTVFISNPIVQSYIMGLLTSASYDLLKYFVMNISNKIRGKEIAYVSPSSVVKKNARLGLEMRITENNSIKMEIDNDLSDDLKKYAIDKGFELLKEVQAPEMRGDMLYASFNEDTRKWCVVNVREELIKKAMKTRKMKK